MRKIIYLLVISFILISCDPPYYMLISNTTNQEQTIQIKALSNPIEFHENKNSIFKVGKLITKDSLNSIGNFNKVILPAKQTIKINGVGIAIPWEEAIILNNKDTISARTFQSKGGFFSSIKWAYRIYEE